ncbi:tetratricopeptide repeat protein [Streptomyces sp. NPDC088810]|uniref:tetratricopeptide repeat protein n=1 Tax=Streptomyces sp. NPDC088810 TaxID=3365904 RepID=UPI00381ABCBC
MDSLGYLAHRTGEHALALAHCGQALTLRRELGDAFEEADTLAKLGDVHDCLGRADRASKAWEQARSLYLAQRRPGPAARVDQKLRCGGVPDDGARSAPPGP